MAVCQGEVELGAEALSDVEFGPAFTGVVRLRSGTDEIVVIESVAVGGDGMERGELSAEVGP